MMSRYTPMRKSERPRLTTSSQNEWPRDDLSSTSLYMTTKVFPNRAAAHIVQSRVRSTGESMRLLHDEMLSWSSRGLPWMLGLNLCCPVKPQNDLCSQDSSVTPTVHFRWGSCLPNILGSTCGHEHISGFDTNMCFRESPNVSERLMWIFSIAKSVMSRYSRDGGKLLMVISSSQRDNTRADKFDKPEKSRTEWDKQPVVNFSSGHLASSLTSSCVNVYPGIAIVNSNNEQLFSISCFRIFTCSSFKTVNLYPEFLAVKWSAKSPFSATMLLFFFLYDKGRRP